MSLFAIAEACNALAALLEKSAPRGLNHPRHAQHVAPARRRIKAVMVHFFDRQRRAVLADVRPKIKRELLLYPSVKEASQNGKTFARSLVPASLQPLSFAATGGERDEYDDAIVDLIGAAAKSLGATAGADYASTYLRQNSLSKLTGELNSTSIERLQDAIANAWDEGGTYADIVASIEDTFDDFTTKRAELIAQQETATAYNSARQSIAESLGFDEKSSEIESDNPCEDCLENEAEKWIDADSDFPNGGDAPPFHVNCMCVVNFRKTSESDDEEE